VRRFQKIRSVLHFNNNQIMPLYTSPGGWSISTLAIPSILTQGEMYDWEDQFISKDNDINVLLPEYDIDEEEGVFEDGAMDDHILQYLGVDHLTPEDDRGGPQQHRIEYFANQYTIQVWTLVRISSAV
jgi:hypothetical protein